MKLNMVLAVVILSLHSYALKADEDGDNSTDEIERPAPISEESSEEVYCNYMVKSIIDKGNAIFRVT